MPDGYELCGDDLCESPLHDPKDDSDPKVWCVQLSTCKSPCACHLFRQLKPKKGDDPNDPEFRPKHYRDPGRKGDYEPDTYRYFCWCAKKEASRAKHKAGHLRKTRRKKI